MHFLRKGKYSLDEWALEVFMILANLILAAIFVLVIGGIVFGMAMAFSSYLRYRGQRLVTCPETLKPAAVHVNAVGAAKRAAMGNDQIRLDQCSQWPERQNCGQECLSQVEADPEACLVWNIVSEWYKGKSCGYCQKPFVELRWHDRQPALLGPDRTAKQWNEIRPEKLPEVFETHVPICWNCYIAETFRREHPELVLNRPWNRGAGGEYTPREEAIRKE
jgi:hypothetical protein